MFYFCYFSDASKIPHSLEDINFGIADFDSEDKINLEPEISMPSSSHIDAEQGLSISHSVNYDDKFDMIKSRKRRIDIRQEFSDNYSSEEEYLPYPDEVSDELTEEEFDEGDAAQENATFSGKRRKKKGKLGKHHKELRSNLKPHKQRKPKKVVDDGDVKSYLQRMRELRIKEKLKEEGRAGDVTGSDISDEEESDNREIALKGGFALSAKMWRKLYK